MEGCAAGRIACIGCYACCWAAGEQEVATCVVGRGVVGGLLRGEAVELLPHRQPRLTRPWGLGTLGCPLPARMVGHRSGRACACCWQRSSFRQLWLAE